MRFRVLAGLLLLAAACSSHPGLQRQAASGIGAKAVATNLNYPAAFTFFDDGRILYGERFTGEIRAFNPKTNRNHLLFRVPSVVSNGEQGLLGLAIHPRFPDKPFIYAYATRNISGTLRNQIVRITVSGGTGGNMKVIFSSATEAGSYHDGGRIKFGPDGKLYAVVGESHSAGNAQNLSSSAGKILRMTPSGGVPGDNPIQGSRVFAYGIRNSYGFGFDPKTGRLWETENGPECNDELNHVIRGRNHGWGPHETCSGQAPANTNQDGPDPVMPKRWYTPTIAPTGLAFCRKCGLGRGSDGRLFFGAYNTSEIRRVTLTSNRLGVARQSVVYRNDDGILSMERGPNGVLYFSDSDGISRLVRT